MPVLTTHLKSTSGMLFCYSWDSRHRSDKDTAPRPDGTGTGTGSLQGDADRVFSMGGLVSRTGN
jgi:hypothetical protein